MDTERKKRNAHTIHAHFSKTKVLSDARWPARDSDVETSITSCAEIFDIFKIKMSNYPQHFTVFLKYVVDLLGTDRVFMEEAVTPFCIDRRNRYQTQALAVAFPASVEDVVGIVNLCREWRVPMVPQGGNTSLCGAATPNKWDHALVISMSKMNQVISVDAINDTITVEAGITLSKAQEAAHAAGKCFPAHWAAAQTCQMGGALATNAGGLNVMRYGNMRELALGIEVVLSSGEVWNGLRTLRKDNAGYDLKHLFIGSEGTLGIITKAVFRLFSVPKTSLTALVAVSALEEALHLLCQMKSKLGLPIAAFELISRLCFELLDCHCASLSQPFKSHPQWAVLLEIEGSDMPEILIQKLSHFLAEQGFKQAILARTLDERNKLWQLRESIADAQRLAGVSIKHDISLPISVIPDFIARCDAALQAAVPGVQIVTFGHLGDGSLHYNVFLPHHSHDNAYEYEPRINEIVYDTVLAFKGSFSAEHGIGQLKRTILKKYRSPVEIKLMQEIKQTLDPDNLMNPGKVL